MVPKYIYEEPPSSFVCQSDKSPPDTVKDLLLYKANSSSLSTVNVHKTLTQPTSKKDQKLKIFASKYYKLMLVEW